MIDYSERALIILVSYEYESLQLTLKALNHTLNSLEKVVIILNGRSNYSGMLVERICREWAALDHIHRFVVRPLCAGEKAYWAIKEILEEFEPIKNTKYICKIDDDIIPLKKDWMNSLANAYSLQETFGGNTGFVTGLINNNNWGFAELIDIFNKREEYGQINNYKSLSESLSGGGIINEKEIANGAFGSVWKHPYLAWWIHQWTSLCPNDFINKTMDLGLKEIPEDIHYSIGCIFFEKSFWLQLQSPNNKEIAIDELMLHKLCIESRLKKWALMNEPIIHLFYYTQRLSNKDILPSIAKSLSIYFQDSAFNNIRQMTLEDRFIILEEKLYETSD